MDKNKAGQKIYINQKTKLRKRKIFKGKSLKQIRENLMTEVYYKKTI